MSFETMSLAAGTVHMGPSLRNRVPILLGLKRFLDPDGTGAGLTGHGLDISAGTGAHLEVLAPGFPTLEWTATEYLPPEDQRENQPSPLEVIDAFSLDTHANVSRSLPLDLAQPHAEWDSTLLGLAGKVRLAFCCNVVHITPWAVAEGLFAGAGHWLKDDGVLAIYGPFSEDGVFSSEGNRKFDATLRGRNEAWGIRDLVTQVDPLAERVGLRRVGRMEMPANNLMVFFARR